MRILIGLVLLFAPSALAGQQDDFRAPVYGWKRLIAYEFTLYATKVVTLQLPPSAERLRLELHSEQPVDFAIGKVQSRDVKGNPTRYEMRCNTIDVLTAAVECTRPAGFPTLFVADSRGDEGAFDFVLGIWLKDKERVDRATSANKGTITIFEWTCTERCEPAGVSDPGPPKLSRKKKDK